MPTLLDTHAWVWWVTEDRRLSARARAAIASYWRKMKASARIRLRDGRTRLAAIHWYEAHGIGKKEFKRKRYLD